MIFYENYFPYKEHQDEQTKHPNHAMFANFENILVDDDPIFHVYDTTQSNNT